jgi:hypothetical protein
MQINLQCHGNYMATAKHWNGMSKNDQNTCLETPDTTPNARLRYLSLYEDILSLLALSVCKIKPRTFWGCDSNNTIYLQLIWHILNNKHG